MLTLKPKAIRQLLNGRVTQDGLAVADHHRHFPGLDFKTIQQLLRCLVGVQIHVSVRMCVAPKKLAYSQGVGTVPRAHHDQVAEASIDERKATQNKRPHENLTQLGILGNQRPEIGRTEFKKLASLRNPAAHKAALPGDHRDLAGEFARFMRGDRALAPEVRLHDLHAS